MKTSENYIVINGVRYDVVDDNPNVLCDDCDLFDKCDPFDDNVICHSLFGVGVHFEKHFKYEDY